MVHILNVFRSTVRIIAKHHSLCSDNPSMFRRFEALCFHIGTPFQSSVTWRIQRVLLHEVPHRLGRIAILCIGGVVIMTHTINHIIYIWETAFASLIHTLGVFTCHFCHYRHRVSTKTCHHFIHDGRHTSNINKVVVLTMNMQERNGTHTCVVQVELIQLETTDRSKGCKYVRTRISL